MNQDKYISFEPWWAGYSNVRMSYEIALAISEVTGRKLILPPKVYLNGINTWSDTSSYYNIFNVWDIEMFMQTFNVVPYEDVDEYAKMENGYSYFLGVDYVSEIKTFDDQYKTFYPLNSPMERYVLCASTEGDIESFRSGRDVYDLNSDSKFIHFPRNLFGHFYHAVYMPTLRQRNSFRHKIMKGIVFQNKFYEHIEHAYRSLGSYNSMHVRRGDMVSDRPDVDFTYQTLKNNLNKFSDLGKPMYIATDEKFKEAFDLLGLNDVRFLSDFVNDPDPVKNIAYDMIMCSMSDEFIGSRMSTFTDYINVNRASLAKPTRTLTYMNAADLKDVYTSYPWEQRGYGWENMSKYFWEPEKDDRTIFISISSYRDPDLTNTIKDAIDKAAFPDRLKFGLCIQDEDVPDGISDIPGISKIHMPYLEAQGVGYARNLINTKLYTESDFYLCIDSHTRFAKNWDVTMTSYVDEFPDKTMFTGFPPDFRFDMPYNQYTRSKWNTFCEVGRFTKKHFHIHQSEGRKVNRPTETNVISAANLYGRGDIVDVIKYDEPDGTILNPHMEQSIYSCLAFIKGYKIMVLPHTFIWHNYSNNLLGSPEKYRPLFGEDVIQSDFLRDPSEYLKKYETHKTVEQWIKKIS
jgi:hypothetical protein